MVAPRPFKPAGNGDLSVLCSARCITRSPPFIHITLDEQAARCFDGCEQLRHRVQNQDIEIHFFRQRPRHRLADQVERGPQRAHRLGHQPDEEAQLRQGLSAHHRDLREMGEGDIRTRGKLGSQPVFYLMVEAILRRLDDELRVMVNRSFSHAEILSRTSVWNPCDSHYWERFPEGNATVVAS